MTLYKPDLANRIEDDINGMADNFDDLDPAVVERDSNSNGYYEKYADGTLKCWKFPHELTYSATSRLRGVWTFPHAFHAAPGVIVSGCGTTTTYTPLSTMISKVYAGPPGTTSVNIDMTRINGMTDFDAADTFDTMVMAIGRWTA